MMEKSIFISGAGGHGVQSVGKALTLAAFEKGYQCCFSPKYGIEKRGGLSSCYVVISDDRIGNPRKACNDIVFAIDQKSFYQFKDMVKPGGYLLVNRSLVKDKEFEPDGYRRIDIGLHDIAMEMDAVSALSTLTLGITAGILGFFEEPEIFTRFFPAKIRSDEKKMELNRNVLLRGWSVGKECL